MTSWVDRGFYLQVHPHIEALLGESDPRAWIVAARALRFLGDARRARVILFRAARKYPTSGAAQISFLRSQLAEVGPHEALRRLRSLADGKLPGETPALRAERLSLTGLTLSRLRDFERSLPLHEEALHLAPGDPWLWLEMAFSLERMDRLAEATDHVEEALRICPGYRAALQSRADLLIRLDRRQESRELLHRYFWSTEVSSLGLQLFDLERDDLDYVAAERTLARVEDLLPRLAARERAPLYARKTELALFQGDYERAAEYASLVKGDKFHSELAERLRAGAPERATVRLEVGLVAQHHNTCAPATLTAISRYFERKVDHLEVVERICYDGTPESSERKWAEESGFYCREFRITWDVARALLDRGLPFTLTTRWSGGAHLQAVTGYSGLRRTLFVRDPSDTSVSEYSVEQLLERNLAHGPRGMLLVPRDRLDQLEGLELPDAVAWDGYHRVQLALELHDRARAVEEVLRLEHDFPSHRLSLQAARSVAIYDGNEREILRHTEQLLERFPNDGFYQLSKAVSLSQVGGEEAHLSWLESLVRAPDPDPEILLRYGSFLADDFRKLTQARSALRRALRRASLSAAAWSSWASLLWSSGAREEALEGYRFTSCLSDSHEGHAAQYFRATQLLGRAHEGLRFLELRAERLGARSHEPYLTWSEQLESLDRSEEAARVLELAEARHPRSGPLLLALAAFRMRRRRFEEARGLLARARELGARGTELLLAESRLAEATEDYETARRLAEQAAQLDPLNPQHHALVARQLARTVSREAATAWITQAVDRHPFHYGLLRLLYSWVPNTLEANEAALMRFTRAHPGDDWAQRELALLKSRAGQYDEALRLAKVALERAPHLSASHSVLGEVLLSRDSYESAREALREALRRSVDNTYALRTLIERAPTLAASQQEIRFVFQLVQEQVTDGDALLTLQDVAQPRVPPAELRELLHEAHRVRPDLWQAWAALASFHLGADEPERALELLERATQRFLELPRLHLDKAEVLSFLGRREQAKQEVRAALDINPSWSRAVRTFVNLCFDSHSDHEEAEKVARLAVRRSPDDPDLLGLLGWTLEKLGRQPGEALEHLRASLLLDSEQTWVWRAAERVLAELPDGPSFDDFLDEILALQPAQATRWLVRARHAQDPKAGLAAAERVLNNHPRDVEAWELRFQRLLDLGRASEVLELLQSDTLPSDYRADFALYGARAHRALGHKAEAKATLQSALKHEGKDRFVLERMLADLHDEADELADYLAAAQRMRDLSPSHPNGFAYLGHALLRLGRPDEAIEPLRRALDIEPTYHFAWAQCLEAAERSSQPSGDGERGTKAALRTYLEVANAGFPSFRDANVAARAAEYSCQAQEQEEASLWLERALEFADLDDEAPTRAIEALKTAGHVELVDQCAQRLVRAGRCSRGGAAAWLMSQPKPTFGREMLARHGALLAEDPSGALAFGLLNFAGETCSSELMGLLLDRFGQAYSENVETFGRVAWALICTDQFRQGQEWLGELAERPNLPVWVLQNAAVIYSTLQLEDKLAEVAERLRALDPTHIQTLHWSAFEAGLAGDVERLEQHLTALRGTQSETWMEPSHELLEGFVRAMKGEGWHPLRAALRSTRSSGRLRVAWLRTRLRKQALRQRTPLWWRPFRALWLR